MHIYIYPHTYVHAYICTRKHMRMHDTIHTLKYWYQDPQSMTNMHTHVYKRIDVQIHTHMHINTYIHVRTHTHIHIYTRTHTKCTHERTQARLERRCGSEHARRRCTERKLCTSRTVLEYVGKRGRGVEGYWCFRKWVQWSPCIGGAKCGLIASNERGTTKYILWTLMLHSGPACLPSCCGSNTFAWSTIRFNRSLMMLSQYFWFSS